MARIFGVGGQGLVNTTTTGDQREANVAKLSDGGFVVVWEDAQTTQVMAQRYTVDGVKTGGEIVVTTTNFYDTSIAVSALPSGGFVIAWDNYNGAGVEMQLFAPDGSKVGGEQWVSNPGGLGFVPSITTLTSGSFVVTWDENLVGVMGQMYTSAGVKVGGQFVVAASEFGVGKPQIAALSGGGFVVTWDDPNGSAADSSGSTIRAQLYNAAGAKVGGEVQVNSTFANDQTFPAVVGLASGGFVVTWTDASLLGGDAGGTSIKAQIYTAAGAKVGGELLVNTQTTGNQSASSVSALADGRFVITWQDASALGGDTSGTGIKAQVFTAAGAKDGAEFLVNALTAGAQTEPAISPTFSNALTIAWTDVTGAGDTSGTHLTFQRYVVGREGTAGNDTVTGSADIDYVMLDQGGVDSVAMGAGNDLAYFGGAFTAADSVDGGAGTFDRLVLQGNYSGGIVLGASHMANVESVQLLSGSDTSYGLPGTASYSYAITLADSAVTSDSTSISGQTLRSGENLTIDGSAETSHRLSLSGGAGVDTLTGGSRNDVLNGGSGVSVLSGGSGDDWLEVGANSSGSSISGGAGIDTLWIGAPTALASLSGIEHLWFSYGTSLTLTGSQFANGLAFNTQLSNWDALLPGALVVNMDPGVLMIGSSFTVGEGTTHVIANGTSVDDYVKAVGYANNTLTGGGGQDFLRGGQIADIIDGGPDRDKITGFGGADKLTGGAGADQFRYLFAVDSAAGAGADHITDFLAGTDQLDFRNFDGDPNTAVIDHPGFSFVGTQAFHATGAAEIRYGISGQHLLVEADVNGDGAADLQIWLDNAAGQTLTSADFML